MNGLNSSDRTDSKYWLAHIDDVISFWKSKVKVTAGRRGGECIHVDAVASKNMF